MTTPSTQIKTGCPYNNIAYIINIKNIPPSKVNMARTILLQCEMKAKEIVKTTHKEYNNIHVSVMQCPGTVKCTLCRWMVTYCTYCNQALDISTITFISVQKVAQEITNHSISLILTDILSVYFQIQLTWKASHIKLKYI